MSALPGAEGISIIAGHRDAHCRFLQFPKRGENLSIETAGGDHYVCRVTDIDVVTATMVF